MYGGGGNSGAPFRNDFIELYNRGTTAIDLTGWSVQYAATTGTNWSVTTLSGSIAPGGYYLVQEAAGSNVSAPALPTPDAAGTIAMALGAGKVALLNVTTLTPASSIPLNFSLGGNRGLSIFAPGYPLSKAIACPGGTAENEIAPTETAGQSGLSYSAATDAYTYVWKTEKAWANTCREVVVKLTDASVFAATFRFRR